MVRRAFSAVVWTVALLLAIAGPVSDQAFAKKKTAALDADREGPDPLAPKDGPSKTLLAPGAPIKSGETTTPGEPDAIVALVRQRLASEPARGTAGEREDHAALTAFYAGGDGKAVWTSPAGYTERAALAIGELRRAGDWGLRAGDYEVRTLEGASLPDTLADAEIRLGLVLLKYGRHARGGRLDPRSVSRLFDQTPPVYEAKSLIAAVAAAEAPDAYLRGLHPQHPQFERLRQALLVARGMKALADPSQVRIPGGALIKPGEKHAHVALVRQRLGVPPPADGNAEAWDEALIAAVKAFQERRGLKPTGGITNATRTGLNDTLKPTGTESVLRLIVNMERWRWMPEDLGAFYVWDSVPEQMTKIYKDGKLQLAERIVVGKPATPTPMFTADMLFIIFHPSWGVPPGMKANELLPALQSAGGGFFGIGGADSVLQGYGLKVSRAGQPVNANSVSWSAATIQQYDFTQDPGPNNVLGVVKFRFPNKHNVYMHDTPERHLFGGAVRAFSHGCMRVQNPIKFAEVLLAQDKGWPAETVNGYLKRGGEIKLTKPIPVHITYFTSVVGDDGKVQHWPDLYGVDPRVAAALDGPAAAALVTSSINVPDEREIAKDPKAKARAQKKDAQPKSLVDMLFGN